MNVKVNRTCKIRNNNKKKSFGNCIHLSTLQVEVFWVDSV